MFRAGAWQAHGHASVAMPPACGDFASMTPYVIPSERSEPRNLAVVVAVLLCAFAPSSTLAAAPPDPSVRLYDTMHPSDHPLVVEDFATKRGWKTVHKTSGAHQWTGDTVIMNNKTALVLRRKSEWTEAYSATADGILPRTSLRCLPQGDRLQAIRIVQNDAGGVEIETPYISTALEPLRCRYRLTAGEPTLQACPGKDITHLWLLAQGGPGHVLVPAFFGDDMVSGAPPLSGESADLPAENSFIHVPGAFFWMLVCTWESPHANAIVCARADGRRGNPVSYVVECAPGKPIWLTCLEGPKMGWGRRPSVSASSPSDTLSAFQPPFPAKWRASFVGAGGVCDSITFEQPPEKAPVPETWRGPVIVYPIDRSRGTPLTTILPMDVLRSTLGVGPCQYILDAEGLGGDEPAPPDAVVGWIERLVKKKRAARSAEEIKARLDAMLNHLAAVRARIDDYAAFGKQVRHVCREAAKKDSEKEVVKAAAAVLAICDRLDHDLARGRKGMQTPDEAAKLAREIAALIEKPDALTGFEAPGTALRAIGHAFDATLARSRMAARRMKAYCRGAKSDVAKTVETMAERMLRPSK
jgi:hypothetical protein